MNPSKIALSRPFGSQTSKREVRDQHFGPLGLRAFSGDGVGGFHLLEPEALEGFADTLWLVLGAATVGVQAFLASQRARRRP